MICKGPKLSPEEEINKECDIILGECRKKESKYIKLLLLGTGESGKTTIIKQMKILHINGFSEEEKKQKVPDILQNVHESIYSIISNMTKLDPALDVSDEDLRPSERFVLDLGPNIGKNDDHVFTDEYFGHVKTLWGDPNVQKAFERSNEYQLIDSAQHFLDQIDVVKQPNYVPTVQDILYCRVETRSISQINFSVPVPKKYGGGQVHFSMYDVGGQRGHRKKWISVFDDIKAILFLIAASDFDQTLREDETTNRLEESFQIFRDVFWSRYVSGAGKLVFLNKQDLLRKKIEQGKKVEKYFPKFKDYVLPRNAGNPGDEYERAKHFMRDEIMAISRNRPDNNFQTGGRQEVYTHFTIATDTNNIKLIFKDVHDLIIRISISEITGE